MKNLKGLFIASFLPTSNNPEEGIFYYKLIYLLNRKIKNIYLIYPKKLNLNLNDYLTKELYSFLKFSYRPIYLSLGFLRYLKWIYKYANLLSFYTFSLAIKRTYIKLLKNGFSKPDFLYSHFIFPGGLSAAILSAQEKIPCFVAVGESSLNYLDNLPLYLIRNILNKVDIFISVNTKNAKILNQKFLINNSKIIILPNAADRDIFYKKDFLNSRKKLNLSLQKKYILFVGTLTRRKGFDIFIKMALKNPNYEFIAIGRDTEKMSLIIKKIQNLIYLGPQPQKVISDYMNASDLFAFFSRYEGSPNALLEANATKLPILCSDIDEHHEILGKDGAFYSSSKNISQLEDLEKIFNSKKYYNLLNNSTKTKYDSFEKRAHEIFKIISKNLRK